ncbi:MAG: hypothetical protein ACE5IH_01435 [Thermodesulfobacteriota bacterium]
MKSSEEKQFNRLYRRHLRILKLQGLSNSTIYRGVISEKNIVANQGGKVTFRYVEGKTKKQGSRPSEP